MRPGGRKWKLHLSPTYKDKDHQNTKCSWDSVLSFSSGKNLRAEPRPYPAVGKGPHHKDNRVAAGHQLPHIADDRGGKRSADFHAPNREVM